MKKILGFGIFGVFLICILLIVFSSFLKTGTISSFTFKSLLDIFSNIPSVDIGWSYLDLTIYGDWGFFNFLRVYLNWFTEIWEFLLVIVGMLWQGLNYILYFVRVLFV